MAGLKVSNGYARELGDLYHQTPKAVFAAMAVSLATVGGDYLDEARERLMVEWWALYENGIVPQRPPGAKVTDED